MPRRRGPALLYITSDGTTIPVDRQAVTDPRERDLFRAMAARATNLAADADQAQPERPFGFTLTADTTRTGD